ncbi:MAG: hypothetical protein ABI851_04945 [Saprospiraceae bacterium]
MNKLLILFTLLFIYSINSNAQFEGFCGSSASDNFQIRERMFKNREEMDQLNTRTGAIKYVPLTYYLAAKDDGTGRAKYLNVLNNICALNAIYLDQEIQFYLKGIIDVNNTFLYDDPSSTFGKAALTKIQDKNKNSINIYVASKANGTDLGVLAFYNPNGDYLVSDLNYVTAKGFTLAHEIGHYFSLPHTFYGWENTTYDCTIPTPTELFLGGTRVLIEYVERLKMLNNKLHCEQSADGFCDTQADYELGLGATGCTWDKCAKDPDEVPLITDPANIMSYFLNCPKYFSTDQKAAIARDYLSTGRNYIKNPVHTPLGEVLAAPQNGVVVSTGFNSVTFKWDAVPNATKYLLEFANVTLSNNATYKNFILKRLDTTFTNLTKGIKYAWRVSAYNETYPCPKSTATLFYTNSNFGVATKDILNFSAINLIYNGSNSYSLNIDSNIGGEVQFQLFTADGKLLSSEKLGLQSGMNTFEKSINSKGLFTYRVFNKENSIAGKLITY